MIGQISNRERIKRCLLGQPVDRAPWFLFFGPWPETEQRWRKENNGIVDYSQFDFDAGIISINQTVNLGFCPAFQYKDVVALHKLYPDLTMLGGIDKRALSAGPEALAAELERIRPLLGQSRYIPALDHLVPPDVSWQNFCAYSDQLRQMILDGQQYPG